MKCDACGKEMTDDKDCSLVGISFKTKLKKDEPPSFEYSTTKKGEGEVFVSTMTAMSALLDIQINHPDLKYLQAQMGKYALDKEYNICFECWLKSMGVKP